MEWEALSGLAGTCVKPRVTETMYFDLFLKHHRLCMHPGPDGHQGDVAKSDFGVLYEPFLCEPIP